MFCFSLNSVFGTLTYHSISSSEIPYDGGEDSWGDDGDESDTNTGRGKDEDESSADEGGKRSSESSVKAFMLLILMRENCYIWLIDLIKEL